MSTDRGLIPPRRVMVIEDSTDDQALMLRALQRTAPAVEMVSFMAVEAGLSHLRDVMADGMRRAERYALLVVDLGLSGTSGLEFIRAAKLDSHLKRIPLVVFSASRTDDDLRACYEAGANSCVQKPVAYREFEKRVAEIYRYWLRVSELPPCIWS